MSEKIYDNFDVVLDDGSYKNSSNCFGLEEIIGLGVAGVTNNFIKMQQLMNLLYSVNISGDGCGKGIDIINAVDDLANDNPFMNKVKDVIVCYIFNTLDFSQIFGEAINAMNVGSSFLDDITEYKENLENLVNFESDVSLDVLDDIDELVITNLEDENNLLDEKIREFMFKVVEIFCYKFNINNGQKEKMIAEFEDFSIVDFTSIDDLIGTIKGVFKTVFVLDSEEGEGGIIGGSDGMLLMDLEDYFQMFTNTYYSIFEYLLSDFNVDFSNLETFFTDAESENNKNLRFMFYIFDSLKYDAQFLKQKIILESLYEVNMHDGQFLTKDGTIGHKETVTETEDVYNTSTTHGDVYICTYSITGMMNEPILYAPNMLVGKEIYTFRKTTIKVGGYFLKHNPELELNRDNLKSYLVSKFNKCFLTEIDVDSFINKFMNHYGNWYWQRFNEFGSVYEEVRTSGHEFVGVFTPPDDYCGVRNQSTLDVGDYTDVRGYTVQKPTVQLFHLEYFNNTHLVNGGQGGKIDFRQFFILGIKDFIDFENVLGLIQLENEDTIIDIADDFISVLADDVSEFVNDIFN